MSLRQAVIKGIDRDFVEWAEGLGQQMNRDLSTSQIRNIFGSVKKMEMQFRSCIGANEDSSNAFSEEELLMLQPRLAYAAKRHGRGLDTLKEELTSAINAVVEASNQTEKNQRFKRFCEGFEAILAYHRAAGGK